MMSHSMPRYSSDTHVHVEVLSRQPEPDGVLVGRRDTATFLLLPPEAVEILDDLASGMTVGEAQRRYVERHGETPDMEDLLTTVEEHGFVRPATGESRTPEVTAPRYHFEWISPRWARRLYGPVTLTAGTGVTLLAAAALVFEPSIVPGWRAAYFPRNTAAGLLFLMVTGLFTTFLHEMGHVLAARARGVSCRFAVGNQLWFLTWETDMTGIWALPRRQRYLPLLGGPLLDLFTASVLVLLFFASTRGWVTSDPTVLQFGRALLFIYVMRIVWQCYFFLRTDFYYAFSNLLGCRSLMRDTEDFLRNVRTRLLGRGEMVEQRHLAPVERRMVRIYSGIWLTGRVLAFLLLLFIQLPLLYHYVMLVVERVRNGAPAATAGGSSMPVVTAVFFALFFLSGLAMWLRQLWFRKGSSV
jgi:putative peptide zinc metalloprotease protein